MLDKPFPHFAIKLPNPLKPASPQLVHQLKPTQTCKHSKVYQRADGRLQATSSPKQTPKAISKLELTKQLTEKRSQMIELSPT